MLRQYQELKKQYSDAILFFRLGDFYEMFFEDARTASPILNVVLTSREGGQAGRIPMCGIPYHARDSYISKLIKAGHKVAICEQMEDPAKAKALVKRDVIRIITSGTFIDETDDGSRFMASITPGKDATGVALIDLNRGRIQANQYRSIDRVRDILAKLPVYECVFPLAAQDAIRPLFKHPLLQNKTIVLSPQDDWCFNTDIARKALCDHFSTQTLRGFGLDGLDQATASAGALLEYVKSMNRMPMKHISSLSLYSDSDFVYISPAAVYGLALPELFSTIDRTRTSLGKRCLKHWLFHPLKDKNAILKRQSAVTALKDDPLAQEGLTALLKNIPDIEKSLTRISSADTAPRDLLALRCALTRAPEFIRILEPLQKKNDLFTLDDVPEIRALLETAVNPDMPLSNPQGKVIRQGYNNELDELRSLQENARDLLKNMQQREIQRTGISSLKIGYTSVFGYYIEVTKANLAAVPADYIRKQTLVNAERFITPELKEYEEKMLTAEEKVFAIERELIAGLHKKVLDCAGSLQVYAYQLAVIDSLCALSLLANEHGYTAPAVTDDTIVHIDEGRHPVVEKCIDSPFIPNDTLLDCRDNHLIILTGPNMSGKSTYIRQTALLTILAQIGSYVPAKSATIGIVDKIFTRIGAHDEITRGQSTFMVEMSETAGILNNLSERSLVILDEIGRGTSTFDGLSLAWAIAEHLNVKKARCLFATHFHELTALAEDNPGVKNYNVAVKEWNDEVVFLHKIVPGGTDESYGIYVAKLAGIPQEVIKRSREVLMRLEMSGKLHDKIRAVSGEEQLLFTPHETGRADGVEKEICAELAKLDLNTLTPLQIVNKIQELKEKLTP